MIQEINSYVVSNSKDGFHVPNYGQNCCSLSSFQVYIQYWPKYPINGCLAIE